MTVKILVINPNSSEQVTKNLEKTITQPENVQLFFYTGPSDSPKEITPTTSLQSEKAVLEDFKVNIEDRLNYDGYLVCCYSDHPLVYSLGKLTKKPVMGIMQATLLFALLQPTTKTTRLFILTSTSEWELVLDQSIIDFVGADNFPVKKFEKTRGLNVNVTNLADEEQFSKIYNVTKSIFNEYKDVGCVLLGCAGMAGLDTKLGEKFPNVRFIDSVKIGIEQLVTLIRFDRQV